MELIQLVQQPEARRDESWETDFLSQFAGAKVRLENEQPQAGPDGFPYMLLRLDSEGQLPVTDIMTWAAGRGIGLAINTHKMVPDYIFTFGMVWGYVQFGRFARNSTNLSGQVDFTNQPGRIVGPPSDAYLPPYVRSLLREFLQVHGFADPKVLVVSSQDYKDVDLLFSIESLNNIKPADQKLLAEKLSWFLPLDYSLVMASASGWPEFSPLI